MSNKILLGAAVCLLSVPLQPTLQGQGNLTCSNTMESSFKSEYRTAVNAFSDLTGDIRDTYNREMAECNVALHNMMGTPRIITVALVSAAEDTCEDKASRKAWRHTNIAVGTYKRRISNICSAFDPGYCSQVEGQVVCYSNKYLDVCRFSNVQHLPYTNPYRNPDA